MKTKYKAIIAICCVLLAGCVTAAAILLMPDRTTADDGEEFDPADVDKFTVEDKYKDVLERIKAEMTEYYDPNGYASFDEINYIYTSPRDISITEDSIAGRQLFDGHLYSDWRDSDFDETKLMSLWIKHAIALQYRHYLCGLYLSEEYTGNLEAQTWLKYRIAELIILLNNNQKEIDNNLPDVTGFGGEPGWPETGEQFVPETVIPVTLMPETAVTEE